MPTDLIQSDLGCSYKHFTATVKSPVDPDSSVDVECYMSTDSVDGDNEVMIPGGVDLSRFNKNPVVMLCHAMGQPGCFYPLPVGKALWTKQAKRGVLAGVRFSRDSQMGREIKALFDEEMLRSFSVGFRPLEVSMMTRKEAESRPDWLAAYERTKGQIPVHRKWHLVELSVAPIPSNPDALVTSYKAKGILVPSWLKPSLEHGKTMPKAALAAPEGEPTEGASSGLRFDLVRKAMAVGDQSDVTPADARVMIGLAIPPDIASTLAVAGGEPPEELHVTLCYLGRAIEVGTRAIDRIQKMCRAIASYTPPLKGSISGVGRFSASSTSDSKDVVYASADLPDLTDFRQRLADNVRWEGVEYSRAHGFTPHVTLAYIDPDAESPVKRVAPVPVEFLSLSLWVDGERTDFPFDTGVYANGGPVGYIRSATDIEAKGMNDDDLDDEEKACSCGEKDCEKCSGMAEGSTSSGGATVRPKAEEPDEEDDEDMDPGTKAMGDEEEPDEPEPEEDEDDDPDEIGPLKRYDHVSVKAPHYKGVGRIESMHTCGHVPHSSNHMMGSRDDPAACVKCYRKMGDGHVPTDDHVAVKVAHITKLGSPLSPPSKKSAPSVVKKTVRTEPIVEPLPEIKAKSDQEVRAELVAKLNQMLSPEGFRKIAREEAERAAGYV